MASRMVSTDLHSLEIIENKAKSLRVGNNILGFLDLLANYYRFELLGY